MSRKRHVPTSPSDAVAHARILSGAENSEAHDVDGPVRNKEDIVAEINDEFAFVLMGSKAVVIRETDDDTAPSRDMVRVLSLEAFGAYVANRSCFCWGKMEKHGKVYPVPQLVKIGPLWINAKTRRTYDGVEFYPDAKGEPGRASYFNLWRGFSVVPDRKTPRRDRAKKYRTYRDHLLMNICAGNYDHFEWLFAWFAWIIQRPRERLATSVVLRGEQGTGKTIAGAVVGSLIKSHYFLVDDPRYLTGQFNAHLAACLLLQVDEGFWAGDKTAEGRLKGLISSNEQMIEAKGIDPIFVENRVNVMFSSNESWVVPAGTSERRYAVFDVAANAMQNHKYFDELTRELDNGGREALLADLLDYDLDAPGAVNPKVIPKTAALLDQKIRSFDPVTAWWYARLNEGAQTHRSSSWRTYIPKPTLFNDYVRTAERQGVRRRAAETEFGMRVRELVPSIAVRKRTEEFERMGDDGRTMIVKENVRCWEFPGLDECRQAFARLLHQEVQWEDPGGGEAGESADTSAQNADEVEEF